MQTRNIPLLGAIKRHPLLTLIIVAFVARLAVGMLKMNPDTWEFGKLAGQLLSGNGYSFSLLRDDIHPSAFMPPGYAFIIYFSYLLFGTSQTYFVLLLLNCLAGAMGVGAIYLLVSELINRRAALLVAFAWAFFPTALFSVSKFHPYVIYTNLGIIITWLAIRWARSSDAPQYYCRAALTGIFAGLMCYFRAEYIAIFALFCLWAAYAGRFSASSIKAAALAFAVMWLIIAPWTIRNYVVFERFIPVASSDGFNLWRGHNPWATGSARQYWQVAPGKSGKRLPTGDVQKLLETNPQPDAGWEPLVNDYMKKLAIDYALTHPRHELQLLAHKLYYFWVTDTTHPLARQPVFWGPYLLIAPFFLAGLWTLHRRHRNGAMLIYLQLAAATLLAAVFFVVPRYRMTMDPFIFAVAIDGFMLVTARLRIPLLSDWLHNKI